MLRQVKDEYDVIIIDCQPSLGLLTVNALTAADGVIIPVAAEFFALRGVALLMQSIEKVQSRINPSLEVYGVLVTMYTRTLHCEGGVAAYLRGVPRQGVPFRDFAFHQAAGFHGGGRADHHLRAESQDGEGIP